MNNSADNYILKRWNKVLNSIDAVVRLSEDIFRQNILKSHSRTPKKHQWRAPGLPSCSSTQHQLWALIDVGFNVSQMPEFGISTLSYCEITND